jgi:hypothetical protein
MISQASCTRGVQRGFSNLITVSLSSLNMDPVQNRVPQASFVSMVAHSGAIVPFTSHSTVTPPTNPSEVITSRTTEIVDTTLKLAKEVGDMLSDVPYVKALAGIIVQIITIRDVRQAQESNVIEYSYSFFRKSIQRRSDLTN